LDTRALEPPCDKTKGTKKEPSSPPFVEKSRDCGRLFELRRRVCLSARPVMSAEGDGDGDDDDSTGFLEHIAARRAQAGFIAQLSLWRLGHVLGAYENPQCLFWLAGTNRRSLSLSESSAGLHQACPCYRLTMCDTVPGRWGACGLRVWEGGLQAHLLTASSLLSH
jgi:hypothetical protein